MQSTDLFGQAPAATRVCITCGREAPLSEFRVTRQAGRKKMRLWNECIPCSRARCRRYHHGNPVKVFDALLRRKYGIGIAEYQAMHDAQGGVCAICKRPERSIDPRTKSPRRLAVDHCHDTGQVRGLLCCPCNQAIGQLQHDPSVLRAAIDYLVRTFKPAL